MVGTNLFFYLFFIFLSYSAILLFCNKDPFLFVQQSCLVFLVTHNFLSFCLSLSLSLSSSPFIFCPLTLLFKPNTSHSYFFTINPLLFSVLSHQNLHIFQAELIFHKSRRKMKVRFLILIFRFCC